MLTRSHSAYWLSHAHFWAAIEAAEGFGFELLDDFEQAGPDWFSTWMNGGEL